MSARPVKVVLGEALSELRERETALAKFETETAEVRQAIKLLEKALGEQLKPLHAPRTARALPRSTAKPSDLGKRAVDAVRGSFDRLTQEQIAELLEHKGPGLAQALAGAVNRGQLELIDGHYGVASPLAASPEDQQRAMAVRT